MEKIIIAVGSTRKPKIGAVSEALSSFAPLMAREAEWEVVGIEVESGVGATPATREESMTGARSRAEALERMAIEKGKRWNYFVGLEGGLDVVYEGAPREETLRHAKLKGTENRRVFLESWAYVSDGTRGQFGRSGGVEIPEALAHEVLENGVELSVAIDRFAGAVGIRDAQGAWGVLSGNLVTRQEAFRLAVIAAFAPFFNHQMYRKVRAAL